MSQHSSHKADFIGKGWAFPPSFSKDDGAQMVSGIEDVRQSLWILLTTTVGERFLEPKYGCNLEVMLFEPMNLTRQSLVIGMIKQAVMLYEARIRLHKVILHTENLIDGRVEVELQISLRQTNSRLNMVFPFYKSEATEV